MKKSRLIFLAAVSCILTFGSCKKSNAELPGNTETKKVSISKVASSGEGYKGTPFNADSYSEEAPEYKERNPLHLETDGNDYVVLLRYIESNSL